MLGERLRGLRVYKNLPQEFVAEKLNVSRQSVQKWETDAAVPTIDKLIALAELYQVTLDYICRDMRYKTDSGGRIGDEMFPTYEKLGEWELWSKSLQIEYRQCIDEGKDIERYFALFEEIAHLPATEEKEKMCDALFSIIQKAKTREGYPYYEPDEIDMIHGAREAYPLTLKANNIEDKMLGGWYGRICGCLLGKPIEGISSGELREFCKRIGNYPLHRYIDAEEITDEVQNGIGFPIKSRAISRDFGAMPIDDDTNYMAVALDLLKNYGRDFCSEYVGCVWLDKLPKTAFCTAERVAFNNFSNGFSPPDTGRYKNAYREWIGAQIRGDVFGYVNPCNTEAAAEMAWKDARLSHVKNGIYGEMWVSAMIAAAYGAKSLTDVIKAGLAEIPAKSRLHEAIARICEEYESGVEAEECFGSIAARWDEKKGYDWCHTVSNAEIVAASLLYGMGDYGKSICMAVSQGFDTDCNGATVGSVLGVYLGYGNIPRVWTDRIHDTLYTSLIGYSKVSVTEMAKESVKFIEN